MTNCHPGLTPVVPGHYLRATATASSDPRYSHLTGTLLWLLQTRPDLNFAVTTMSRHLRRNDDTHMAYGRQVMRYLKRTRSSGLTLRASSDLQLRCWVDSSYAEDPDTRRSCSSIIITLGSSVVFSKVFLQPTVAVSSCEAELNGFFEAALWLEFLLRSWVSPSKDLPLSTRIVPQPLRCSRSAFPQVAPSTTTYAISASTSPSTVARSRYNGSTLV
jgi:hypothetical protein